MRGLRRFVEDLLKGRRPRRFPVEDADAETVRVAIELRAARPGSGAPREEFVTGLHRRLAQSLDPPEPNAPPTRRRLLLFGGALTATGAAAGVTIDRLVTDETASAPTAAATVSPDIGRWQPVVAAAELPEGAVRPFDTGGISGFVTRKSGRLQAVSGVCTHQGCRLSLEARTHLRCPCHGARFDLDGVVLYQRLPTPLRPLPRLAVRETDGTVHVYVPAT